MIVLKIAILGGTFNPIHIGHLIIGQYVINKTDIQKVIFLPNGIAPHKANIVSSEDRLKMVELSIEENDKFIVSDYEIKKTTKSYTIETLKYFKEYYQEVYFIIGSDNLYEVKNWYKSEQLLKENKFIVLPRIREKDTIIDKINELTKDYNTDFLFIDMPIIDISSSEIRELIKQRKSIKYLVHWKVEDYIKRKGLYIE
ncbi:nicotinate (nicotinamide) nucleotide adenylyltransferase [Caldicellulosiruptoraceae bacterium PP1]